MKLRRTSQPPVGAMELVDREPQWMPKPRGRRLRNVVSELATTGVVMPATFFDFIDVSATGPVNFSDVNQVAQALPRLRFAKVVPVSAFEQTARIGVDPALAPLGDRYLLLIRSQPARLISATSA